MADVDPPATQPDVTTVAAAELRAAGFTDIHQIGRGGFGVVFRCAQRSLDRMVAVKVLTADLEPRQPGAIPAGAAGDGQTVRAPAHRQRL